MPSQCRHVRPTGDQCRAHRVWREDYCFFHLHHRTPQGTARRSEEPPAPPPSTGVTIPLLEDVTSVQLALNQVLTALSQGKLTPAEATTFIYGLRLAAANSKNQDFVTNRFSSGVECFVRYENGDVVGPEQYSEEKKPAHPLIDSGMIAFHHLINRLNYEATLDAYLSQGLQPPDNLTPPVPRPTGEKELLEWIKAGWQLSQTRSMAVEMARKAIPEPPAPPAPALARYPFQHDAIESPEAERAGIHPPEHTDA